MLSVGAGVAASRDARNPGCIGAGAGGHPHAAAIPALAAIPVIVTADDQRRRRRTLRLSLGGSVAALTIAITGVHLFIMPLDVLWLVLVRRFGI